MKDNKKTYWKDLKEATQTTAKGLGMTWEHFQKSIQSLAKKESNNANAAQNQSFAKEDNSNLGIVTNLYPHEMMPIPDNGRYKLHNEIDDCIVCNKCVEVCPVNCIEIDAIRGTEQVGRASDGSPIRFYAAKFDIDMAKCCFCGLCTVVCPTECLTMTKEFDFSETDVSKMNYEFGNLNEQQIIEKQKEWDDFEAKKNTEKAAKKTVKPIISKPLPKINKKENTQDEEETKAAKKPVIKIKKIISQPKMTETENNVDKTESASKKIVIKPKLNPIKIKIPTPKTQSTENQKNISDSDNKIPSSNNEIKTSLEEKNKVNENTEKKSIKIPKSTTPTPTNKENKNLSEVKKNIIKIKIPKQKNTNHVSNLDNIDSKASNLEKNSKLKDDNSDLEKE